MNSGSGSSSANDINTFNEITGGATVTVPSGQSHAFYKTPNTGRGQGFTDLGVLSGATSSAGNGINDSGHIVGTSGGKAVLWFSNGATKDLSVFQSGVAGNVSNLNGWTLTTADKINDNGFIIGSATKNGVIRAVILVPNKVY